MNNHIKEQLQQLPNFTDKDIEIIMSNINWIASGDRQRYQEREQLLKEFIQWGRDFTQVLRDKYNLSCKNTNYSSWEYGNSSFTINVYYVFPSSSHENFTINSKEDFKVSICTYMPSYRNISLAKTPEEAIDILTKEGLYK